MRGVVAGIVVVGIVGCLGVVGSGDLCFHMGVGCVFEFPLWTVLWAFGCVWGMFRKPHGNEKKRMTMARCTQTPSIMPSMCQGYPTVSSHHRTGHNKPTTDEEHSALSSTT